MSRSSAHRQQRMLPSDHEVAASAAEMFDLFCVATTMRQILGLHRDMCDVLSLRPAPINEFYPQLKAKIRSWKAQALWKKFDARAAHRVYAKGNAATGVNVLVIGAGPCGLRSAIEAQLLGAKVVVVEKRDRITRNNVLHLWPFVITDLRNLGAKKFYGKFCAGSIDHISIRQLQIMLMKVALLLGVEIHEGISFEKIIEPTGDEGWRAAVLPRNHAVSCYEFDVLIGADGKRNTLEGFRRKEFRGKLAIAITANFINKKTEAEAKAEEISGVAFIFNQSFFKELYEKTGIDLENIVYYKDETHYFVMTAKKHSLIDKGVILQDSSDPAELLSPANVSAEKLLDYAREAAEFSTKYQMPNLEFAVNHYGKPDVAMFDFTSMFAAEASCRAFVRNGYRLLQCLVGDSLLEPFWPTGSGCARGFLSSMDAAYAIKLWANPHISILSVVAQRESIYRLLNQTTPENLQRDIGSYTVDPASRYPNLNRSIVNPVQVRNLVDADDISALEYVVPEVLSIQAAPTAALASPIHKLRRGSGDAVPAPGSLLRWFSMQVQSYGISKDLKKASDVFSTGKVLCAVINRYRPDLVKFDNVKNLSPVECNELAFRILEKDMHIPRIISGEQSCTLEGIDSKVWLGYLNRVRETFRGAIPYVKRPKLDIAELREKYRINITHAQPDFTKLLQISTKRGARAGEVGEVGIGGAAGATAAARGIGASGAVGASGKTRIPMQDMVDDPQVIHRRSVLDEERVKRQRRHEPTTGIAGVAAGQQAHTDTPRRAKKRRNAEKAANIEERQKRLEEIEQNRQDRLSKRRQQRYQQTQNFYKSLHMLQANTLLRESDESSPFEDYSIFLYRQQAPVFNDRVKELERKLLYPDRDRSDIPSALPRSSTDEQFSDRIKSMEQRITSRNNYGTDKKPKDLMRAIGKIDSSDWNVREIEKKIEQSKKTEIHGPKGREKVPKWSKEQFTARQKKMAKPTRQESVEEKFKEIDQTLKNLDKQLKEGSVLEVGERGRNKVASIAGQFVKKDDNTSDEKNPPTVVPKSSAKVALAFKKQAASEKCHFCKQTVYLMEKITAENLVFHRSCLKCHHCHTNLRLGGYAFDRDDPSGRFYCTQHFRLPAKAIRPVMRKPGQRKSSQQQPVAATATVAASTSDAPSAATSAALETPDKLRGHADSVVQLDLLDRGQTPERIEFENTDAMSDGEPSEEHILDEHEWSGRNFLPESNNDSESDLSSSDESDSDSDPDMFEEANDSPLGAQTLQLATDWIGKQNYSDSDDSDDFYDSSEGIVDDDKDDTEGEEFEKARELRREEVRLLPLPANLPTDTETELKSSDENKENVDMVSLKEKTVDDENQENVEVVPLKESGNENEISDSNKNLKLDVDRYSEKSFNSEKSFQSATSVKSCTNVETNPVQTATTIARATKTDIEKIEQNSDRKFSAEIEAISEKLHRLNSVVKMNKDLENIAKENLVKSDILKKLSLKEKWLADNTVGNMSPLAPKAKFDMTPILSRKNLNGTEGTEPSGQLNDMKPICDDSVKIAGAAEELKPTTEPLASKALTTKQANLEEEVEVSYPNHSNTDNGSEKPNASTQQKQVTNSSRSNSFKSNASSSSPKMSPKSGNISRTNSLKRSEKFISKQETIGKDNKMQIENLLGIVKKIDKFEKDKKPEGASKVSKPRIEVSKSDMDIGKMLYDAENKFSPKVDRRMSEKLKEIEARNFAGTMETIKSQMVMPTVSTQQSPSVDISKYFPNQKQERGAAMAANKNQKTLKDVDLAKYFPTSPTPQKRNAVVTVADRLKKSQTEKLVISKPTATGKTEKDRNAATTVAGAANKLAPKRQASLGNAAFSLRDHQLDGAADFSKKKTNAAVTAATTAATATVTKKGNVKIVKKVVPKKGVKTKKTDTVADSKNTKNKKTLLIARDESDKILDELLQMTDQELRSPSLEYQKLFKEEKSPSEDVSDKIERIFQETGIDLGIPKKDTSEVRKKLLKTKSLGEGEFERPSKKTSAETNPQTKEDGDRPSGVQSILKHFESMSSIKSSEQSFKLQRMESTTSNLNRSRESIVSRQSESESLSDLEKTMEYLKLEWRNEATNFLQKKRDSFFAQKRLAEEEMATKEVESKKSQYDDIPIQYRESAIAKFFGIKAKSPEKRKSPSKKKSPEKRKTAKKVKSPSPISTPSSETDPKPMTEKNVESVSCANKTTTTQDVCANFESSTVIPNPSIQNSETVNIDKAIAKLSRQSSNDSDTSKQLTNMAPEQSRPVVEDIKNLPKTGCDKSLNSSRRSSQTSLQSRRCSDSSLTEKLENAVVEMARTASGEVEANVDEMFKNIVEELDSNTPEQKPNEQVEDECDSLCTSISKSPSVAPITVKLRGSSEDESIEKLFSKFSDEMLVNVEFDSNDELIAITPRIDLAWNNGNEYDNEADKDFTDRLESLEKDEDSHHNETSILNANYKLGDMKESRLNEPEIVSLVSSTNGDSPAVKDQKKESDNATALEVRHTSVNMSCADVLENHFPTRPQRRQKSTSSSSEGSAPIAPQRIKKKLSKLCPNDMPPSVQDLLHLALGKNMDGVIRPDTMNLEKFPRNISEDELVADDVAEKEIISKSSKTLHSQIKRVPDNVMNIAKDSLQKLPESSKQNSRKSSTTSSVLLEPQSSKVEQNISRQLSENKLQCNSELSNPEPISEPQTKTNMSRQSSESKLQSCLEGNTRSLTESVSGKPTPNVSRRSSGSKLQSSDSIASNVEATSYPIIERRSSVPTRATANSSRHSSGSVPQETQVDEQSLSGNTDRQNLNGQSSENKLQSNSRKGSLNSFPTVDQLSSHKISPTVSRQSSKTKLQSGDYSSDVDTKPHVAASNINLSETSSTTENPTTPASKENTLRANNLAAPKVRSKEKSLEWDMEKLPISPMPRRKFVHSERQGMDEMKLRQCSPTSSIQLLNNLPHTSSDSDESQRRTIQDFEMERRQALIKRDKVYQKTNKPSLEIIKLEKSVPNSVRSTPLNSMRSTPVSTPMKQSPRSSRRSTQNSLNTSRDISPPMFKKLVVPSEYDDSPSMSSRCSSFAFIEMFGDGEPRIAPMPKKLQLPKEHAKYTPDKDEPIAEVFKNRSWPKPQSEHDDILESDDEVDIERTKSEPSSPIPEIFLDRHWPDGKTDFSKQKLSDINRVRGRDGAMKSHHRMSKPHSHSPQLGRRPIRNASNDSKTPSKSVSDLRNSSPFSFAHESSQSSCLGAKSSHSSAEIEHSTTPQRPLRVARPEEPVDVSTQMLLDRSQRLHNRKRDFINERAVERNPYMKDVINEDRLGRRSLDKDNDELESYRPPHHAKPLTRFPTSRSAGRSAPLHQPSYITSVTPSYPDYGLSSRRSYTTALPSSTISTHDYNPYLSHSTAPYVSSTIGRGSHFMDYFKRSPSFSRDRDHSKESCVQSESESSSPEEVELNSATEISTDSEFDHDEIIRETPKIFIDDTHLRRPTKVQVKSTVIGPTPSQRHHIQSSNAQSKGSYLQKYQAAPPQPQFKPLVQVDPLLLSKNRAPLQNPRPGDYMLNKTASTEGIASKKSLELKKRYLLGEQGNGNKIQKSGSTSVLDSRIRSFQSNISECQKLLNPGNDISPSMKTFLDRTKLGENPGNELMRSATTNIINDLKVEITIQKASSTASTDNEKENVFVNSKNELNKGMEYSETVNTTLLESINKKSPSTPTNNHTIIETIDLVTPEKATSIIDLTTVDIPSKMLESNIEFINNMQVEGDDSKLHTTESGGMLLTADSNKIIDLTCESPVKSDNTIVEDIKPDVSRDVKESIPDILGHIGSQAGKKAELRANTMTCREERQMLLSHSGDEEKMDSPEKPEEQYENDTVQIQVPNIPWSTRKAENMSSTTGSSCTSNSSSIEDIQHYILESTTSPDTQTGVVNAGHQVPRVEIHDSSGTLMQIDSLMIIDGKYVGDPEDLKFMEIPEGVIVPEVPAVKTSEIEDENEQDIEPVTATPEPAECTVIEAEERKECPPLPEQGPPLPEKGPPNLKSFNLKFDTKNENKIESLKNLPLIVEQTPEHTKTIKPVTLNLSSAQTTPTTPTTPTATSFRSPTSPLIDNDRTPTADLLSKGSDSETEATGTGQALTETELSDWTADDCISENFVDMEFVLNSNKGTIKRNKKGKKKLSAQKLPSTSEMMGEVRKKAPVAEFEGILKTIDIDDIEFMDTGSEGSCAEAYSATNTALLRNRGYMEFIETTPKQTPTHQKPNTASDSFKPLAAKRDEKLGIDYIEQGAYIMQGESNEQDLLKTPVNEDPQISPAVIDKCQVGTSPLMTQSLTDSSTLNDMEDDSLFTVTPNSQQLSSTITAKTTTEESEALTVVTSPLDSSSPKTQEPQDVRNVGCKGSEIAGCSTPSSSEKNPRTSQSTWTPSSTSTTSSGKVAPSRPLSQEIPAMPAAPLVGTDSIQRKLPSELSYEECVRALQQKITQISTARDSLDTRKQRRKSSKGDVPAPQATAYNVQTVIEATPSNKQLSADDTPLLTSNAAPTHKVPEIPTLTRKLEEITKERTKQKDLIHDLVMDKLQSKKQLNAEKRLHRSRQRTLLTGGYSAGCSLSPTPKLAAAATTSDANCTNRAHYHESTAADAVGNMINAEPTVLAVSASYKENNPLQKSATYVSAYGLAGAPQTRPVSSKQRPFSEHLDPEQLDACERFKLSKTSSFSFALPAVTKAKCTTNDQPRLKDAACYKYTTPMVPARPPRVPDTPVGDESITASTENLRSEARARARLKSNTELGLSPEEKMQLLRKRLHFEHLNAKNNVAVAQQPQLLTKTPDAVESELIARDRRLSASKSVNDLTFIASQQPPHTGTDENSNTKPTAPIADFTSDPNLLLSSTSAQSSTKPLKAKSSFRQKDPERRKSLIQSLSSFFHKSYNPLEKREACGTPASAVNSAQTEGPGTSGSNTTASGSVDGMFSRFRISPKSKEKSKEKDALATIATTSDTATTKTTKPPHERCTSQDCIPKLHSHNSKHTNPRSTTSAALSSSSPQLFIHKPCYASSAADEQVPPPIPPLPLNYQRSDDESYATETREQKKQRAISKAVRQAELKRLRIAQEIQREQEEIEVQLRELEARGVLIEKALRGEGLQHADSFETTNNIGSSDERLLKELLEIWRNIKQLKKRDEELGIRQQELQLEHRHAQLKEELNLRLSCNKLEKSSADVAAEGAILNEMLEIVAKRAALRPTTSSVDLATAAADMIATTSAAAAAAADGITLGGTRGQSHDNDESHI